MAKVSLYECDAAMFRPEPPDNPRQVRTLFCGRKSELERGLAILKANSDVGGRRYRKTAKHPWVIHGESRSGKSHLARMIVYNLPKSAKRVVLVVPARERQSAVNVMGTLCELIRGEFLYRINDVRLTREMYTHHNIEIVSELLQRWDLFRQQGAEEAHVELSQVTREQFQSELQVADPARIFKFIARCGTHIDDDTKLRFALRKPTSQDIAELCQIMIEILVETKLINHVVILVDDVDLLEGFYAGGSMTRMQRPLLTDAIVTLHDTPSADVVITSRTWYAQVQKEYVTLVDLAASQLTPQDIVEIYDRRWQVLGVKAAPCDFMTKDCLQKMAKDVDCLPGVFLQHLNSAFEIHRRANTWCTRDYAWYVRIQKDRYDSFCRKCPEAAKALADAVRGGSREVVIRERNPFYGTMFENEFVYQSYYGEHQYFVSGVVYQLVADEEDGGIPPDGVTVRRA